MNIKVYSAFKDIPSLSQTGFVNYFFKYFLYSIDWFSIIIENALEKDTVVRFYVVEDSQEKIRCILPTRSPASKLGSTLRNRIVLGNTLSGITNNKTILFSPIYGHNDLEISKVFNALAEHIRREIPHWSLIDFAAMDMEPDALGQFKKAFQSVGYRVKEYNAYSNWYEKIQGSFEEYLQLLPKKSKKSVKNYIRKYKKNVIKGELSIRTHEDFSDIDQAFDAYLEIFDLSWKGEDIHPGFMKHLFEKAFQSKNLRLVFVYDGDRPVSVDMAMLHNQKGILYRTAYLPEYSRQSVGAIAILKMIEYLIDKDHVKEIDFGRDDEDYKTVWVTRQRYRKGILLYNLKTIWGIQGYVRHIFSQIRDSFAKVLKPYFQLLKVKI